MSDVFYSQFSPTRYPETAAAAQRSPMRSAVASQGHPIDLVPKWQPPRAGRSKSPVGGRLPGWTRGTCRSLSPPGSPSGGVPKASDERPRASNLGRNGLLASNDCLQRLRERQSDEHAEDGLET